MKPATGIWPSVLIGIGMLSAGCVGLQPYPHLARAGDTVTLALGPVDGLTRANVTVTFTSNTNPTSPVDLTPHITGIFRLYPDKTSKVLVDSVASYIPNFGGHEVWLTLMAINLPPTMPVGPGTVKVATSATYPYFSSDVNYVPINLEILPGTGQPFPAKYSHVYSEYVGNLSDLEPLPQVVVRPAFEIFSAWPSYGAVEMTLTLPRVVVNGVATDPGIRVVFDDMNNNQISQTRAIWTRTGNSLTVRFVSSHGMPFYEPRFSVVLYPGQQFTGTPTLSSVKYYDLNGFPVTGPMPTARLETAR